MRTSTSGQQQPGPGDRPAITRRRVIAAAALLAGVGVTDAACGTARRSTALRSAADPTTSPSRANSASTRSNKGALARRHKPDPHQHGHEAVHHRGSAQHHKGHDHKHEAHHHHVEHVDLPRAQVRVRRHPAYYVDDLMSHAPKHAIGLTIDDGPNPEWTPKVLRLLDKYHMHASFCVIGMYAEAYPRLIRDIHRAGHTLVNHSYSHPQPFASLHEKRIVSEITRAQRAIEHAAKVTPRLFRSPGGDWSHFLMRACAAYGLDPLDWNIDPDDWTRPGASRIKQRMERARPNDIVLCHDGGGNRAETVRALRKVLPHYKHRGYTTVALTVPPPRPAHPTSPSPSPTATPSSQITTPPTA